MAYTEPAHERAATARSVHGNRRPDAPSLGAPPSGAGVRSPVSGWNQHQRRGGHRRPLPGTCALSVVGIETAMFRGRRVHPAIEAALDDLGMTLSWNPPVVHADTIVFYNPSCLRFDTKLAVRLSCAQELVVTLENFLGPNGSEGHDVATCLDLLDARWSAEPAVWRPSRPTTAAPCRHGLPARAPAGRWRRPTGLWCSIRSSRRRPEPRATGADATRAPVSRSFRRSRRCCAHFPAHAERCAILGGDGYLRDPSTAPAHWEVLRFGEADVADFLAGIDFFVYFTHPLWRESFGRVIVEAIAAGKVVITDPGTAEAFGEAVVASEGSDVDRIIEGFIADPRRYVSLRASGAARLSEFRPAAFAERVKSLVASGMAERR